MSFAGLGPQSWHAAPGSPARSLRALARQETELTAKTLLLKLAQLVLELCISRLSIFLHLLTQIQPLKAF